VVVGITSLLGRITELILLDSLLQERI